MAARSRPLSPHLQVYRFTLTMANSIIQRGTGMAMYLGTLLIVLWVGAAALGDGPVVIGPCVPDLVGALTSAGVRLTKVDPHQPTLEELYFAVRKERRELGVEAPL